MKYPADISGFIFGHLLVLCKMKGVKGDNSLWLCECRCGRADCKGMVTMRRGNITRSVPWNLSCGSRNVDAAKSARTKLESGVVQKNSSTGIPGVNFSASHPGKYRARICMDKDTRREVDNLTLLEAIALRRQWEEEKKQMLRCVKASA